MGISLFAFHMIAHQHPIPVLPLRRIVIEQRMPPALLEEKIVTVEEVVELFAIFFEHCHRQCPFLDADIHTPAATGSRSPFLFTCSTFALFVSPSHVRLLNSFFFQSAPSPLAITQSETTTSTASVSASRNVSRLT